jgi:hypothetical protein
MLSSIDDSMEDRYSEWDRLRKWLFGKDGDKRIQKRFFHLILNCRDSSRHNGTNSHSYKASNVKEMLDVGLTGEAAL